MASISLAFLLLLQFSSNVLSQITTAEEQTLQLELSEERIKRQQLEIKVNTLAASVAAAQNGGHSGGSDSTVVFYSSITKDKSTFANHEILVYDKVWLNEGNGYNATDGKFRAPVEGLYYFYIKTRGGPATEMTVNIMVNAGRTVSAYSFGDGTFYGSGSAAIVEHLKPGQTVWIEAPDTRFTKNLSGNNWNIFTGMLVAKM